MKKILLAFMLVCVGSSMSFGANSDDVYVRQDVFDAKMEVLFSRLHAEISELRTELKGEISALRAELKGDNEALRNELKGEISQLRTELKGDNVALRNELKGDIRSLSAKVDGLEKRVETSNTFLYYLLVLLGAMLLLPSVNKWLETREEKKQARQSVTIEDVKRLIAEAKLGSVIQS
ncbi:MAG: hypothetical protein IJU31_06150 [Synergistaceae bacterium]|nr:hypothetical protein [Synergistaceae bacterium]